jgi:hypothetical protein
LTNVALVELVNVGAADVTVSVKFCVGLVPNPLVAWTVNGNDPETVGVPLRSPLLLSVTPLGSDPLVIDQLEVG